MYELFTSSIFLFSFFLINGKSSLFDSDSDKGEQTIFLWKLREAVRDLIVRKFLTYIDPKDTFITPNLCDWNYKLLLDRLLRYQK